MKEMMKDAAILFLITLIAGCLLGLVNEVTKDPIKEQQIKAKNEACKSVFADAQEFEALADFNAEDAMALLSDAALDASIDEVMQAKDSTGKLAGYVITVTDHEGYGGDITFTVGVKLDGTVNGISFLHIAETAGLGMRADDVLSPQIAGQKASNFAYTKTGGSGQSGDTYTVDAISGATITTNAVVNGVNAALLYFQSRLGGAA